MPLYKQLVKARKMAGLSQKEVTEKTGINNKSLSNWEHYVAMPSAEHIGVLARLYGVTTDFLLMSSSDDFKMPSRDTEEERSALQKLFDTVKDDSTEEIETYIALINVLKQRKGGV